jgi:hypothetical protein
MFSGYAGFGMRLSVFNGHAGYSDYTGTLVMLVWKL